MSLDDLNWQMEHLSGPAAWAFEAFFLIGIAAAVVAILRMISHSPVLLAIVLAIAGYVAFGPIGAVVGLLIMIAVTLVTRLRPPPRA